ncbi:MULTISPECIES: hypothetical protein [unclassified Anabaena]|uniref:hypothetical protein n=1 Tax=unclassified Anabaena TaxID=2619674 RepID=UPI0020C31EC5|nr:MULTISPECIES: hypothetical protein [unclassified Anabaena]
MSGAKPVTLGQGYSTIAIIPETSGSWALPLLHQRITSFENPIQKASAQLKLVCENLPTRPISLWDSEYGCASFINQTSDIPAELTTGIGLPNNACIGLYHNLVPQNNVRSGATYYHL